MSRPFVSSISRRNAIKAGVLAGAGIALGRSALTQAADAGEQLLTKPIPATGERLPVVGLGTNNYSVSAPEELAERREVLKLMPELGGTVVDTAQAYGRSEEVLGELISTLGIRDRLFLATKTPLAGDVSNAKAVVEESFRRLKTDRLDLLQIHNLHGIDALLPAFQQLKADKRVRYIGITTSTDNQYPGLLEAMRRHPFDFVQVDYSLGNRSAAEQVLPLAQERGMAVLVNMPFGGRRGANVFSQVSGRPLPEWAAELDAQSWGEFFLKYVVSHPAVTVAIPGTTKTSHLRDNQAAGRGRLPDAALRRRMEQFWDSLT